MQQEKSIKYSGIVCCQKNCLVSFADCAIIRTSFRVKHCFSIGTRFGLAMEFVDGVNLKKIIEESGSSARRLRHVVCSKCRPCTGVPAPVEDHSPRREARQHTGKKKLCKNCVLSVFPYFQHSVLLKVYLNRAVFISPAAKDLVIRA